MTSAPRWRPPGRETSAGRVVAGTREQHSATILGVAWRSTTASARPRIAGRCALQRRKERVRALSSGAFAAALQAAVVLAGCGGSSSSGGGTHVKSFVDIELAYSQCMRSHGVPDFPDPNKQGNLVIQGAAGGDLDPNSPLYEKAQKACGPFPSNVTPAQERQEFALSLKAAICMRANGVPTFPDPTLVGPAGNPTIRLPLGNLPNSPGYFRAAKKCKAPSAFTGGP
jgi:hypothetical protein